MVDETNFKKVAREVIAMIKREKVLLSLLKTDTGRLTPAGKAAITEGLNKGMKKAEIAAALKVAPSAITYHTR